VVGLGISEPSTGMANWAKLKFPVIQWSPEAHEDGNTSNNLNVNTKGSNNLISSNPCEKKICYPSKLDSMKPPNR